jgi:hypothetical protein
MNMKKVNWNAWYAAVILLLALQIVLYYLFTQYWA